MMVTSRPPLPHDTGGDILAAIDAMRTSVAPSWRELLAPALPDGFEHVASLQDDGQDVRWQALDLDTGHMLDLRVSRTPPSTPTPGAIPLGELAATPIDVNAELRVALDDGREVAVACSTLSEGDGCPKIAGKRPRADEVRSVATALASIPLAALPDAVLTAPVVDRMTVAAGAIAAVNGSGVNGGSESAFELRAEGADPAIVVRALSDIAPGVDPTAPRRSLTIGGVLLAWQAMPDGSLWTVTGPAPLDQEGAGRILDDVASTYADRSVPTYAPMPTTVP